MEYIWSLEEELEDDDDDWNGGNPEHPDAECDYYKDIYYKFGTFETLDKWFAHQVERRALHLWRGEQVDGSTWTGPQTPARVPLEDMYIWPGADWPGAKYFMDRAVMAGYRYLVSFRSTPRHMRVNGYVRP